MDLNDYKIDRLSALSICGCGDQFTEHDPGTCGNCVAAIMAANDRNTKELEEIKKTMMLIYWSNGDVPKFVLDLIKPHVI